MAGLYNEAFVEQLRLGVQGLVGEWGLSPNTEVKLLNISENATFRADDPEAGWFGFDFAAAVSFIETDPQIPALMASWIEGYRSVAPLSEEAAAMLPVFVMLRRMQLTAWIASHSETPTAQEMGETFTQDTVAMAERFLSD